MARILVVDDEWELCDALARSLESDGHTVQVAHEGETAVRKVENARPDLVILDLRLPGLDGVTVARRIREKHLRASARASTSRVLRPWM
jgi:DNA-binding response OmpR family regulator